MGVGTAIDATSIRGRARAHFVGRADARALLARELATSETRPRVVLVRGEAGVGKTTLLRVFAWECAERAHRVVVVSGEHVAPNPDAVTAHVASALRKADPWPDLGTGPRPDVLVLDAAEHLWPCVGWIFDEALARAGKALLVVVAARSSMPAKLRAQLGFAAVVTPLELRPFTNDELRSAMEARALPLARFADVERGCAGSPLAFALLAEHFARTGALPSSQSADDPWMVLSQEFLRDATTDAQAAALRALSISRVVDAELLGAMLDVDDARPLYRFLAELSFVDETPRGLVLHAVVRRSIFEELRSMQPKQLARYVERAIDVLAVRGAEGQLSTAYESFLEAFYVARESDLARSCLFLEDMGRHGVRHARDEDIGWIRECVERYEGRASRATFDALVPLQRNNLFVVTDARDHPESVFFGVDAAAAPPDVIESDPVLRLSLRHSKTGRPMVARFWFTRDGYQTFGCAMTALICSGPPLTMTCFPQTEHVFVAAEPARWEPLAVTFGLYAIEDAAISLSNHEARLFVVDLDRLTDPTLPWRERHRQIFRLHARNIAELSAATPVMWPDRDDFLEAVREALPVLRRRLELTDSRLASCALVAGSKDPATTILERFKDAIEELGSSGGYERDAEILRATFLGLPMKHEAVAASLGIPFGTFRHRVRRASARLGEVLWRREVAARS